jgi:hypothetical protein
MKFLNSSIRPPKAKPRGFAMALFAVFITFVIGAFMLLLLDLGRAYIVRTQLRAMVDGAALSAASAYQTVPCVAPQCTSANELAFRRDAAYAAAQSIASNNSIFGLGPMNLGGGSGIKLGHYEGGTFEVQDPVNPTKTINSAKVDVQLGQLGNPLFDMFFNGVGSTGGGSGFISIDADAIGTMKIEQKVLNVALMLDCSGSMAFRKYCSNRSGSTCPHNPTSPIACWGVTVKNDSGQTANISCPPEWIVNSSSLPPCATSSDPSKSRFPVWCGKYNSPAEDKLPSSANWKYPDMAWVPQPMQIILSAATVFTNEIQALNESGTDPLYYHRVGLNKFTSGSESKILVNPTTNYPSVISKLNIQTIYPQYNTDVCKGFTDAYTMLTTSYNNFTGDKTKLTPVIVLITDLNAQEPNVVCGTTPSNGSVGRSQTLAKVNTFDNALLSQTGKGATIFTISVVSTPPELVAFYTALARNGGEFIEAPNDSDIEQAFKRIVQKVQDLYLVK